MQQAIEELQARADWLADEHDAAVAAADRVAAEARHKDDKLEARAILELMELLGEASPDWSALQDWLQRARQARLAGDAKARKQHERLEALRDAVGTGGFEKAFRKLLGRTSANRHEELQALTRGGVDGAAGRAL